MADSALRGHAATASTVSSFRSTSKTATTAANKDKTAGSTVLGACSRSRRLIDPAPEKLPRKTRNNSGRMTRSSTKSMTDLSPVSTQQSGIDEVVMEKKCRRTDRYDSSESSDSGVASLSCSDASPWSSSSDMTEPMSPASPVSPQPSPTEAAQVESNSHGAANPEAEPNDSAESAQTAIAYRRRRHSDSITPETLLPLRKEDESDSKRARRMSGESAVPPSGSRDGRFGLSLSGLTANLKWFSYLWKNKEHDKSPDPETMGNCDMKHPTAQTSQTWPLNNNNNRVRQQQEQSTTAKTAQLKITEFFSTQVKHHWSYSKHKELKDRLPVEPRVSIVSVAHVDTSIGIGLQGGNRIPACPLDCLSDDKSNSAARDATAPRQPAPHQIRFPVYPAGNKNEAALLPCPDRIRCQWQNCTDSVTTGQSLLEHIQNVHVATQTPASSSSSSSTTSSAASSPTPDSTTISSTTELYSCEWEGCKVQGRKSSSRTWLERHVLLHVGNKPFRCIVDSCEQCFSSQVALERHVNAHFNQESGHQGPGGSHGLKRDSAPAKVARRNSKKLKNRCCKIAPARLVDYFDASIMERLRHQLLTSHASPRRPGLSTMDGSLIVHSQVIAKRLDPNGKSRFLLRWTPENMLPDQWVLENEVQARKSIPLHSLSLAAQIRWHQQLIPPRTAERKQRRK